MKPIIFFNHFHNGDLFNSRSFVSEIIGAVRQVNFYAHGKNPKILLDLPVHQFHINMIQQDIDNPKIKIKETDRFVYVNTWIGAYFEPNGECTLPFSYGMYKQIYAAINRIYGTSLSLGPINEYYSTIDYTKFNVSNVDLFLKETPQKKVLFSNGPGLSNQSVYNDNMADIIRSFANKFPNIKFISTENVGVSYTGDIIRAEGSDLIEIAYLSHFCDLIVGRSSGPFSYSLTKENVMNPSKTFLCFGDRQTDVFTYGTQVPSRQIFEKFTTIDSLVATIEKELTSLA